MDEIELDQGHCIDLIAADIVDNNNTAKYPSTLGRDCDSRTKQQLVLYLVCSKNILYVPIFELP